MDLTKWELDRDIPDTVWNTYLNKYKDEYQLGTTEDRIRYIKCKFGQIEPLSIKKGLLVFFGVFPSSMKKTYFKKKIPAWFVAGSESAWDGDWSFPESRLKEAAEICLAKKRKKLSPEHIQKLRDNISRINSHYKRGDRK